MKRILYFLVGIGMSNYAYSQRQADNWLFGHQSGMSFNQDGTVTAIRGSKLRQLEGCAIISDKSSGTMLFYTDGMSVWNRNNQIIENGNGLRGSATSTQSALIVPEPGSADQFYLFTVKAYNDGRNGGLHYSKVRFVGENASVLSDRKNILLEAKTTEKLTAIPHLNGVDYWILSHAWDSNTFLVYKLTKEGVFLSQRKSIGSVHKAGNRIKNSEAMGYLKASPNGRMIASAVFGHDRPFELYDFDTQTGDLSNCRSLGNYSNQYGISFSGDNTKLYLNGIYSHDVSYQFDLSRPDYPRAKVSVSIEKTGRKETYYLTGALQLGKNGKLYSSGAGSQINRSVLVLSPNESADKCNTKLEHLDFGHSLIGLPNFIQDVFNQQINQDSQAGNANIIVYPNPVYSRNVTIAKTDETIKINGFAVYNKNGKKVYDHSGPVRDKMEVDTSLWGKSGLYVIVFYTDIKQFSHKIIKR